MISKENIEELKEMLYMYCKTSKICCLCMDRIEHKEHCFHIGSLHIGTLENLQRTLDVILNDTTPSKFRILEACHYLNSHNYIALKHLNTDKNLFTQPIHVCTLKLYNEMREKQEHPERALDLTNWY